MRTLDSMYNLIFEDESIVELFLNFWGPTWKKLTVERKIEIMTELNEKVSKIYGYTTPILNQVNDKNYGSFGAFNWKLTLNPKVLDEDTGWETLDTYFHELRHAFQHRAVENELTDQETIDNDSKKLWQRNFLPGKDLKFFNDAVLEFGVEDFSGYSKLLYYSHEKLLFNNINCFSGFTTKSHNSIY